MLVCPRTGQPLKNVDRQSCFARAASDVRRLAAQRERVDPQDLTTEVLLREDETGAYPIVDGIPILLAPEMLAPNTFPDAIDTNEDPYREAYEEMDFYNAVAEFAQADIARSDAYQAVSPAVGSDEFPSFDWLDATYDIVSQAEAYTFMSPMSGVTALQLGGSGIHAVKFLLAGAREAWLLTPMLGEARFARELAKTFGVENRFRAAVGIAEEIPFCDGAFDRVYAGGCIHHTITTRAFPQIHRVLAPGGRFAAIEPWRAPLYKIGISVFGKQERGVNCRPMEAVRTEPLFTSFEEATISHHGAFTRYALIALGKLGLRLQPRTIDKITRVDDRLATRAALRKYGSSVALLASRTN